MTTTTYRLQLILNSRRMGCAKGKETLRCVTLSLWPAGFADEGLAPFPILCMQIGAYLMPQARSLQSIGSNWWHQTNQKTGTLARRIAPSEVEAAGRPVRR
jgi:hypothetical protein